MCNMHIKYFHKLTWATLTFVLDYLFKRVIHVAVLSGTVPHIIMMIDVRIYTLRLFVQKTNVRESTHIPTMVSIFCISMNKDPTGHGSDFLKDCPLNALSPLECL